MNSLVPTPNQSGKMSHRSADSHISQPHPQPNQIRLAEWSNSSAKLSFQSAQARYKQQKASRRYHLVNHQLFFEEVQPSQQWVSQYKNSKSKIGNKKITDTKPNDFEQQSYFDFNLTKRQTIVKFHALSIVQILRPTQKLEFTDSNVYSLQLVDFFLAIYTHIDSAKQQFKRTVTKHINEVRIHSREEWAQLCQQRFEKEYLVAVPEQNVVQNIVRVFYDFIRGGSIAERIMSSGYQESFIERCFEVVSSIADYALQELLSKHNALKLKVILACHSNLSQKIQKVVEDLKADLENQVKQNPHNVEHYAQQIFLKIEKTFTDIVKAVLNTLETQLQPLPEISQKEKVQKFIKEYPTLDPKNYEKNAKDYLSQLQNYFGRASKVVDTFLKQRIVLKMMKVSKYWANEHISKQIEEGILKKLQELQFFIAFSFTDGVYSKEYQQWFRGRSEKEKQLLYRKHLNLINYLSLVKPASVVNYYRTQQSSSVKKFCFYMQKGDKSFINFEGGYKFFTNLQEKEKIRYVMDISESLIQLHYHGITHNDITFRNTVRVKKHFKLIDFDVARMVDCQVDLSAFSASELQALIKCKKQIIECSMALYRKQLKEDGIITRTDKKKQATTVQNINRLAQYYFMRNENPMRSLIQSKINEQNKLLLKNQKIGLLNSYQKLIVGKTDCNKFGLMLLKLMYYSSYFNQNTLEAQVHSLLKEYYSKPLDKINFKDYLRKFRFSQETPPETNQEILKLIGKIMNPNLSKRIPMLLFALEFLEIFNIKEYGLQIGSQSFVGKDIAYDEFVKHFPDKLLQTKESQRLLNESVSNPQHREVGQIAKVFLQTLQDSKEHKRKIYSLLQFKKLNLPRPFDFDLLKIDKDKKKTLKNIFSLLTTKVNYIYKALHQKFQKQRKNFICFIHQHPVIAYCEEPGCKAIWLCKACLRDCYSYKDEDTRTSKLQHADYSFTVHYHKLMHLHSKSEIIAYAKLQNGEAFACRKCDGEFFRFHELLELKRIQPQIRLLLDKICLQKECRKNPYLMNIKVVSDHKLALKVLYRQTMIKAMNNVRSIKADKLKSFESYIYSVKHQMKLWTDYILLGIKAVSKILANQQCISTAKGIENAIRDLPYLINFHDKALDERRMYLKMVNKPKIKIENIFDGGDYINNKIKEDFRKIIAKVQQAIDSKKQSREKLSITNYQLLNLYKTQKKKFNNEVTIQTKIYRPQFLKQSTQIMDVAHSEENSKFQLWRNRKNSLPNAFNIHQQQISQIENVQMNQSNISNIQPFEWLCSECEKQQKRIENICLQYDCVEPILCQNCHQKYNHQSKLSLANYHYNVNNAQKEEEDFFSLRKLDNELTSQFQQSQLKYFLQIKSELAEKIQFIEEVIIKGNTKDNLVHLATYQILKEAFKNGDQAKYAEYIFLIDQIAYNFENFMDMIRFAFDRYIRVLNQITEAFQKQIAAIKQISHPDWTALTTENPYLKSYLKNKYKHIVSSKQTFSKKLSAIPARHAQYPVIVQINGLEPFKIQVQSIQEMRRIQFNQLKKKLLKEYSNLFQINHFLSCFQLQSRFNFDKIASFKNLQILRIIDQPNIHSPLYLKSTTIQRIIASTKLKELILRCFNGFDSYCFNLLRSKADYLIRLEIYSSRQLAIELQQLAYLFDYNSLNLTPFMVNGEPMTLGQYFQSKNVKINAAEYRLNFAKNSQQIQETINKRYPKEQLSETPQSITSNCLSIVFNEFSNQDKYQNHKSVIHLSDLMRHYLYKVHMDENRSKQVQQILKIVNERMSLLPKMLSPIVQKAVFKGVVFLDLYGILLDEALHQKFSQNEEILNKLIKQQPSLQNLKIKDSFGIPINFVLKLMPKLKRLVLQNVFFVGSIDIIDQANSSLEVIVLKSARMLGNHKNEDFVCLLNKFFLKELRMLILNDCFSRLKEQFEFLTHTKLQYFSIRRCFELTKDFLFFLKQIKSLKAVDISYTQITQKDFKALKLNQVKLIQKSWESQSKECNLQQISRVAMRYDLKDFLSGHPRQSFLYDLQNFNEIRFVKQVFQQKRSFDSLKPLTNLPNIQILQFKKCKWREINEHGQLYFRNMVRIPYVKQFQKLKELIVINCEIKTINQSQLQSYKYLRSLVLRFNRLEQIGELSFEQLIQLDVSHNYIEKVGLKYSKLPKLKKLNLYNNSFKEIPQNIYEFDSLRLLLTDKDCKQNKLINKNSEKTSSAKALLNKEEVLSFKYNLQQVSYLIKNEQQLNKHQDWHLKLLMFNIEKDIKKGVGMISPETKENYDLHFQHQHISKLRNEKVKQNNKFQLMTFEKAHNKTQVIYNQQFLRRYGFIQKQDFNKDINSLFQKIAFRTLDYYSSQRQKNWYCHHIEHVPQYQSKPNYNFAIWCAKGVIYKSSQELVLKQKALIFFKCYLNTIKALLDEKILHIGLKQSSFIEYRQQKKEEAQYTFKLLDLAFTLHLTGKRKQKHQQKHQNKIYQHNRNFLKDLLNQCYKQQRVQYIKRLLFPHVTKANKPINIKVYEALNKSLIERLNELGMLLIKLKRKLGTSQGAQQEYAVAEVFQKLRSYMVISYHFQLLNCASLLTETLQNTRNNQLVSYGPTNTTNINLSKEYSRGIKQLWQKQYSLLK